MSNVVIIPSDPDHSVQLRSGVDFRGRDIGQEVLDGINEIKNLLGTTTTGKICGYCREEYFGDHSCACGPPSLSNL